WHSFPTTGRFWPRMPNRWRASMTCGLLVNPLLVPAPPTRQPWLMAGRGSGSLSTPDDPTVAERGLRQTLEAVDVSHVLSANKLRGLPLLVTCLLCVVIVIDGFDLVLL